MKCKGILPALLLFVCLAPLVAQDSNYLIRQYTSAEGLPQNSVKSIALDSSSFVWFTTEGGLVRYDGEDFKVFNQTSMPEIDGDRFRELFLDFNGNLLTTNNYNTLVKISKNQPEVISGNTNKIPAAMVFSGSVPDYRNYYSISEWRLRPNKEQWFEYPTFFLPVSEKKFLTAGNNCIILYDGQVLADTIWKTKFQRPELFMIGGFSYVKKDDGSIYLLDVNNRKIKKCIFYSGGHLTNPEIIEQVLWKFKDKTCFAKVDNVLLEIHTSERGDTLYAEQVISSLPDNTGITSIAYQSFTQSYFIGTDTRGLFVYRKIAFTNLRASNKINIPNNCYYSQAAIDSHHVFTSYGLVIGIDTILKKYAGGFSHEAIFYSNKKKLYLTGRNSLFYLDSKYKTHNTTPNSGLISCYYDDGDTLFFAGNFGTGFMRNDSAIFISDRQGQTFNDRPIQMTRDSKKNFWVATCSGILQFSPDLKTSVSIKELEGVCFRSIFNYNDFIFAGSYGNGYYLIKENKIVKMPLDNKNRMAQIHSFYIDEYKSIWFSTNNGLFIASLKEVLTAFRKPDHEVYYYLLNQEDGIKNPEFNGGCSPSVVRLDNGYLSYPTLDGMVWFKPGEIKPVFPENKIYFENLKVDQKNISSESGMQLAADFLSFAVDVVVPFWDKSDNLEVEYKLSNRTSKWEKIEPKDKRLRFGNLRSGHYKLDVRVRHGFSNEEFYYNSITFTVNEFFYEKTWVRILMGAGFIGLTLIGFRIYSNNIIRKNQLLEKSISERTVELKESNELLHENLVKLQESEEQLSASLSLRDKLMSIISHDLVTPIRYISISSRLAQKNAATSPREELLEVLTEIEATTMRIHDNAQNVLHWIRFQSKGMTSVKSNVAIHDLLDEVVILYQPIANAGQVKIHNITPEEDILISDPRILKIVIQNILNNSVKFTRIGQIAITSGIRGKDYRIFVTDTGPGFSDAALESIRIIRSADPLSTFSSDMSEDGTHLGYQIIYEMIRFLHGDFVITSTPAGSTVEIILYNCLQETL